MSILVLLYTVSLLDLCYCREPSSLRKEVVNTTFDLSSPNPSLARDYESAVDGVTYYSYFPKGVWFNKVVDARVTIWEAEGEERCTIPFLSVEGDKSRLVLHVWPNSVESKMLYYEKVYGEWKIASVRFKGLPESEKVVSQDDDEIGDLDEALPETKVEEHETPEVSIEDSKPEKESEVLEEPTIEPKVFTHEDIVVEGILKVYEFSPSTETSKEVSIAEDSHTEVPEEAKDSPKTSADPFRLPSTFPDPEDVGPLVSKVNTSRFNVEEGEEDCVKVLKLKAKGRLTRKVRYDGQKLWSSGIVGPSFFSAILYMDGDKPTLAVIRTTGSFIGEYMEYRYHDGIKWKNCNEGCHINRLEKLKKQYKYATPSTLDLSNPDTSKFDVHTETESGASFKSYTPRDAFHISSVMDAGATVWKSSGDEKCVFVESYAKGGVELLYLETSGGTMSKYFEKVDGQWRDITEEGFNEKAKTMIGESGRDGTLNISHPSRLLCKSFDYTFAANAVRLVVPKKGVSVTKLMNDTEEVYTLSSGETLQYVDAYLNKDGNPELVLVTLRTSSGLSRRDYVKSEGKWEPCSNSGAKIKNLVVISNWESDFGLDVSTTDTKECSVFEAKLLGVTTKHFYPKPGHVAIQVKDGNKELWTGGANDRCLSCLIYKHGDKELLEMVVVKNSVVKKYFEKADGKWVEIKKEDFLTKLNDMNEETKQEPEPSDQGAQSEEIDQQESYDTQTSSPSVNIPEDQDPMTDNSEGNDTVDADSAKTTDNTVKEASEGEVESKERDIDGTLCWSSI
ncbi:hypothetical protein BEWA_016150 [Theileria equi strain WA]|uniref:Signal peptide containing protein n=1 Tax=Theileria equi strain WA TaxID=1537102 RepID=L1LCP7_THEEQ|nr:hypothetical protein BEWA_016150 [Theileria equi strain WA]EKX73054.1 hypothetical protein BEWA_016150 [Theileria equi strain WA]|eukprot:XP_004832506.1 hypothetical protein BEWA_016150 [Theileria equi strain WA]